MGSGSVSFNQCGPAPLLFQLFALPTTPSVAKKAGLPAAAESDVALWSFARFTRWTCASTSGDQKRQVAATTGNASTLQELFFICFIFSRSTNRIDSDLCRPGGRGHHFSLKKCIRSSGVTVQEGGAAPVMSSHGPARLVADCNVPVCQISMSPLLTDWMDRLETGRMTVTAVVPAAELQAATVTATLYTPAALVVALAMDGFWSVELKPFGPIQL